jgi:alcohol dehydrogenase (cytochrome c)
LKEINKDNVKNLKVAWTLHLGGVEGGGMWTHGGLEGTPIVENGVIYVTDGWGSVYKIDGHGGKGTLLWKMDPKTDHDWAGAVVCCGVDNRGVALWGNLVISHTVDGRLIATNKETDQLEWQRQVADPDKGETITGAPLMLKNWPSRARPELNWVSEVGSPQCLPMQGWLCWKPYSQSAPLQGRKI